MNLQCIKMLGSAGQSTTWQNKVFRNLKWEAITIVARLNILIFEAVKPILKQG
jgi:hypothetical protein